MNSTRAADYTGHMGSTQFRSVLCGIVLAIQCGVVAGAEDESAGASIPEAEELEAGGYEAVRKRLGIEKQPEDGPQRKPADFFTDTPFDV